MILIASWKIERMRIVSESNSSEHFWIKSARHKIQKNTSKAYFLKNKPNMKFPCTIHLTRISPRKLDEHDNLPTSMKWIVDSLADCIFPGKAAGRADDSKEITWKYFQEKGDVRENALKIEIFFND